MGGEVPAGRAVGDTGPAGDRAQREVPETLLLEELDPGLNQAVTKRRAGHLDIVYEVAQLRTFVPTAAASAGGGWANHPTSEPTGPAMPLSPRRRNRDDNT